MSRVHTTNSGGGELFLFLFRRGVFGGEGALKPIQLIRDETGINKLKEKHDNVGLDYCIPPLPLTFRGSTINLIEKIDMVDEREAWLARWG